MGPYSSRCPTSGLTKLAPAGLGSVADGHFAHDSRADYLRGTVRLVYDPPTSSPWLAPRNAHTRVRERAGFETRWRRPSAAVLLAILSDRRKSEAEGRGTTQPSTKAAQTPCAASPRPRAASGHSSVSNAAGINGTPLLTCHQIISGQLARTNSAAPSRLHANKRQRLRIIFPQSSTVCAPGSIGQSHKSGDKAVMDITESRISHSEHLFRGAIDELHSHPRGQGDSISLVAANLWTRLPGP